MSRTFIPSLFKGQTALVTGGSRGIGLSVAQELSKRGTNVVILARDEELLQTNVSQLTTFIKGQRHSYISCDITDFDKLQEQLKLNEMVSEASILVNAAGISQASLLARTKHTDIEQIIATNLTAPIALTKLLIPTLIHNKPGRIVNIASVLGLRAVRGTSVYSATKAGILGFTKSLANELGPHGIRVNAVSPGLVTETDMGKGYQYKTPLNDGEGVPIKNVSLAVLGLLQNESVTGNNIVVDNGFVC